MQEYISSGEPSSFSVAKKCYKDYFKFRVIEIEMSLNGIEEGDLYSHCLHCTTYESYPTNN